MTIKTAYNTLPQKEFVDWALTKDYGYFMAIENNREYGWIWSKSKQPKQYKFDYRIK